MHGLIHEVLQLQMNVVHLQLLLVGLLSGVLAVEMRETVELLETGKHHQPLLPAACYLTLYLDRYTEQNIMILFMQNM